MPRIAILGNAGSGKSTLARQLSAGSGAPVLDLDTIAWTPGRPAEPRAPEEAVRAVREFCAARDSWIIEGCYGDLVAAVLDGGVELVFLNRSVETCVAQCLARPWEPHKYPSKEAQDERLSCLLDWVRAYYHREDTLSLHAHRRIFEAYAGPKREIT